MNLMIFDFKANRYVAVIGVAALFALIYTLSDTFNLNVYIIFVVALVYVYLMAKYMKYIASIGYRTIHQKLFVNADAKGYLMSVKQLYKGIKKRKDFEGVKLQNLIMAHIFAGDFKSARDYHQTFLEAFEDQLDRHESVRFSKGMIEALLELFEYDKDNFVKKYDKITEILDGMRSDTVAHVRENPYSIYYMISQLKTLLIDDGEVTVDKVKALTDDANIFLKTSILYSVFKHGFLDKDELGHFERETQNTMFYLDEDRVY